MLERAREGHFACPAISVTSLTTAHAVLKGLAESKSDGMPVAFRNRRITRVPTPLALSQRKEIDPEGWLWSSVLASTEQPAVMR